MRKLNTFVHVHVTDDDGSVRSQQFGPGDDVPDWARDAITNPDVWDGEDPVAEQAEEDLDEVPVVLERPKGNASRDTWAAYAEQEGVELESDMNRDDIIAAVDLSKE